MASMMKMSWLGRSLGQNAALSPRGMSALALSLALVIPGCGDNGSSNGGVNDETNALRAQVLASIGDNVIVPRQVSFVALASSLEAALDAAAADPSNDALVSAAQDAWREAVTAWQELEVMQVGPAGLRTESRGGLDLRNAIYQWDLSLCPTDVQTVQEGYDDPDAIDSSAAAPRGLWFIEYLLFSEDTAENNCSALNTINEEGTWNAFAQTGEIRPRRLRYAASLATLVRRSAEALVAAWAPEGGNFIEELRAPTRSGALYGTAQEGLNEVSNALFYLDQQTKDMKVGEPAGITMCETSTCLDELESRWARHSKENIIANLRGFQAIFNGGDPGTNTPGFDDLLVDVGASDLVQETNEAIANAIAQTEALPGTLRGAIENDLDTVEALHDDGIRPVNQLLETRIVSVLDLEIPARAALDTD